MAWGAVALSLVVPARLGTPLFELALKPAIALGFPMLAVLWLQFDLLARLADPSAARRFVPLAPGAIDDLGKTLRRLVVALAAADLPEEQVEVLRGARAAATPELLVEIGALVAELPSAQRALELDQAAINEVLNVYLNLSAIERSYAAVFEGADNAVLLCSGAIRDALLSIKAALGEDFAAAYLKLKQLEWNSFASHFTEWERDHTLDC